MMISGVICKVGWPCVLRIQRGHEFEFGFEFEDVFNQTAMRAACCLRDDHVWVAASGYICAVWDGWYFPLLIGGLTDGERATIVIRASEDDFSILNDLQAGFASVLQSIRAEDVPSDLRLVLQIGLRAEYLRIIDRILSLEWV